MTLILDLSMTLKYFSAIDTHTSITCVKFHWQPFTKWRDIASRGIGVNGRTTHGRPDGRKTQKHKPFAPIVGSGD